MPFFSKFLPKRMPVSIYVEGNIGSGKTTCLFHAKEMLAARGFDVLTMIEDVERWKTQNLLGDMYDSKRDRPSVRAFQVLGCLRQYVERAHYAKKKGQGFDFILYERHPSTTLEVFGADECVKEMFGAIEELFSFMAPPSYTVYIKADAVVCERRIQKRNRRGEKGVSLRYLRELEVAHENMIHERVARGGVVYEIECAEITAEETAARMCDAALRVIATS